MRELIPQTPRRRSARYPSAPTAMRAIPRSPLSRFTDPTARAAICAEHGASTHMRHRHNVSPRVRAITDGHPPASPTAATKEGHRAGADIGIAPVQPGRRRPVGVSRDPRAGALRHRDPFVRGAGRGHDLISRQKELARPGPQAVAGRRRWHDGPPRPGRPAEGVLALPSAARRTSDPSPLAALFPPISANHNPSSLDLGGASRRTTGFHRAS